MRYFLIIIAYYVFSATESEISAAAVSGDNVIKKLHLKEYQNDIDKVRVQFENLAIHAFGNFIDDVGVLKEDIFTTTEDTEEETETTTGNYEETTLDGDENSIPATPTLLQKRHKREASQNNIPEVEIMKKSNNEIVTAPRNPFMNMRAAENPPTGAEVCKTQTHLSDLKLELNKLQDLVLLLRDQQKIMKILQEETKKTAEKQEKSLKVQEVKPKSTSEELDIIKAALKQTVFSLNETREKLSATQSKESRMEDELKSHKGEINFLKTLMQHFLAKNRSSSEEILGVKPPVWTLLNHHHPLLEPKSSLSSKEDKKVATNATTRESNSDLADISKLLDKITAAEKIPKISNDDAELEEKILEIEEELTKRRKNKDVSKQLIIIQRLLQEMDNQKKQQPIKSKSLDLNEEALIRRLLLNNLKPQSKSDFMDDEGSNMELELKDLQAAIEKLRPRDEFEPKNQQQQFEIMLSKLLGGQKPSQKFTSTAGSTQFSPQQIFEIRKMMGAAPGSYQGGPGYPDFYPGGIYGGGYNNNNGANNYNGFGGFNNYNGAAAYAPNPPPINPYIPNPQNLYQNVPKPTQTQFFPGQQVAPYGEPATAAPPAPAPEKLPSYPAPSAPAPYQNQKIDDLKAQIYGLENVINGLSGLQNKPAEDQQMIYGLEQQIGDLKNIVNSLNGAESSYDPNAPGGSKYGGKRRRRRRRHAVAPVILRQDSEDKTLENLATMFKSYLVKDEPKAHLEDLQEKIQQIKSQLEQKQRHSNFNALSNDGYSTSNYQPKSAGVESKSFDPLGKIILKIVDKLLEVAPDVIKKIFGFSFSQLSFGGGYGEGDGYGGGVGNVFKSLGIFGFFPMLILKIVESFSTFLSVLKKNTFFRTFLMPALILLVVNGAILFLMWFMQSDGDYSQKKYVSYNNAPPLAPYSNNINYPVSNNYPNPSYGRSYINR